jgi:hypothetical protein
MLEVYHAPASVLAQAEVLMYAGRRMDRRRALLEANEAAHRKALRGSRRG